MTLKHHIMFLGASVLLAACCGQAARNRAECYGALETSAAVSTVQTKSGPVAGYVDDGVYIYKGIPFTASLYGFYTIMAVAGYLRWKKMAQQSVSSIS